MVTMLAGLAAATPGIHYKPRVAPAARRSAPATFDIAKNFEDEILFAGVAAPAIVGVQQPIQLGVRLPQAAVAGSVGVSVLDSFLLDPILKMDLSGIKIYLELDLSTSAGVYESIELVASEKLRIAVSRSKHPWIWGHRSNELHIGPWTP